MKSLKKVPPGAKGLRKLPTAVRNKMGYMQKGGKVTKKMVDDNFKRDEDRSANFTNELAKMAATGKKDNGFPMKPAARKALKKDVARRKKREQNAKPNYRYVGTKLPDGPAPFEDDGMPKAKNGMKAVKKYKKGGKVVKYQGGGKSVMLDDVVVKGKKGAGVREQGVVARGKTGAEFTKHRNELIEQFTADYIRKMKRHPDYKLNSREMSDVMDKVRTQMYKDGYQETGVVKKDTKERLSPAMEKAAKDRLRRK